VEIALSNARSEIVALRPLVFGSGSLIFHAAPFRSLGDALFVPLLHDFGQLSKSI
jgi:hypothetical protein